MYVGIESHQQLINLDIIEIQLIKITHSVLNELINQH